MSSKTPTIRQIAWISLLPQLAVLGILIWVYSLSDTTDAVLYGLLTYLLLSFCLRTTIPKDHRKGMVHVRQNKFAEAIPFFEKSYAFFKKNSWIDKYRFLTLLSSSRISYREMALNNMAFCYSQTGNGALAEKYYIQTLSEFPDSGLAKSALQMIRSVKDGEASRD